jgi:hypothetical protein
MTWLDLSVRPQPNGRPIGRFQADSMSPVARSVGLRPGPILLAKLVDP